MARTDRFLVDERAESGCRRHSLGDVVRRWKILCGEHLESYQLKLERKSQTFYDTKKNLFSWFIHPSQQTEYVPFLGCFETLS